MIGIARRGLSLLFSFIMIVVLGTRTTLAQAPTMPTCVSSAELVRQMEEMQRELAYLRQRDAQREAWESSIVERLPQVGVLTDTVSYSFQESKSESNETQTKDTGTSPCPCYPVRCHGFCSCQCPLKEAPCIECPRVSTLNPYFNMHVFGAFKLDMLFSGARPISPGTPFFLSPDSARGLSQDTVDIHARQSTLGAAFTGPQIGCFQSGGLIAAMFYNDNVLADQYGILPLQAWGELKNEDWRFAAGLQFDVFNPGAPTVLPFSALCASGNTGNAWRGQLRLERFVHPRKDVQWTIQTALSEPITSTIDPDFRISEDNGWPNIEGRIALGLGKLEGAGLAAKRPFEMGVSGIVGQIRTTPLAPDNRVVANVWGAGADARWKINDCFGLAGEVYTGQTLGTYNGAILQTINLDTLQGIRSSGGWLEGFFYWTPCLHSHVGYGIDDPIDRDVADSAGSLGRTRNETYFSNLIWDVTSTFRVGFEFTWRETSYKTLLDNEGAGFHTQVQWTF